MMIYLSILAVPEIAQNQNNKYITHNNAVKFLEEALQKTLVNAAVGAGPWNLTEAQFTRNMYFEASGASGAYNVVIPNTTDATVAERIFIFKNADTADVATVKETDSGLTVLVQPGETVMCRRVGNDVFALFRFDTKPYDIGFFFFGAPTVSQLVFKWRAVRAYTLADEFAGSQAHVGTNPTATAVFDVKKNGSSIGSISINTSGVATFSTTGSTVETFAIGDRIEVTAPSPVDATMANISVGFAGTRV